MSPALSAADLVAAGRSLAVPFHMTVTGEPGSQPLTVDSIQCLEVLRLLPGRRLVARARVGATQCVAKLFFGDGARRYYDRERRGLQRIKDCGVPTPELLGCISLPDGAGFGLLLEW
ncbi:MAG: hypothetical protein OES38_22790, partial [Gammaproteobacteria bacterium]|nr:hypothetical protein [Gammaproteobacteria bacterium]